MAKKIRFQWWRLGIIVVLAIILAAAVVMFLIPGVEGTVTAVFNSSAANWTSIVI